MRKSTKELINKDEDDMRNETIWREIKSLPIN